VVDQFSTFIKGGDLDGHVVIFIGPFFVSGLSFSSSDFDGFNGFIVIFVSLGEVNSGLSEDFFVIFDGSF
jgi:hypothetical protein